MNSEADSSPHEPHADKLSLSAIAFKQLKFALYPPQTAGASQGFPAFQIALWGISIFEV